MNGHRPDPPEPTLADLLGAAVGPGPQRTSASRYGLAVAAVAAALGVRFLLDPYLGDAIPFAVFFVPITVAAWLGGRGPALLAVALGLSISVFCFVSPRYSFALPDFPRRVAAVVYLVVGAATALIGGSLREARQRADAKSSRTLRMHAQLTAEARDRELVEDDLRAANERMSALLASISDGLLFVGPDWTVVFANPQGAALTGDPPESLVGRKFWDLHPCLAESPFGAACRRAAERGTPQRAEAHWAPRDLWLEACAYPSAVGLLVYFRDVTARVHAEAALRRSEELVRSIVDNSPAVVFIKDRDGRYLLANRTFERVTGLGPGGAAGKADADFVPPDLLAKVREDDRRVLAAGHAIQTEDLLPVAGEGMRTFLTVKFPLPGPEGTPARVCGIATDVTDLKRAEAALRDREARLRALVDSNLIGIVHTGLDGRVTAVNDEYARITGRTREEFASGRVGWRDITPPGWRPADDRAVAEARERGSCTPYEKEYLRRDGGLVPVLIGFVLVGEDRSEAVAFVLDLSELKRVEGERRRLAAVVETSSDAVALADPDGRVRYVNESGARQLGLDGAAVARGLSLWDFVPPERAAVVRDGVVPAALRDGRWEGEGEYRNRATGAAFPVSLKVSAIRDPRTGEATALATVARDIAGAKRAEAALKDADRRKDEFLAVLAHELRNPLAPIRNSVAILRMAGAAAAPAARARDVIERQVEHMVRLIDDLLDISRITRGKIALRLESIDLARVVEAAVETSRPAIEARQHALAVTLPEGPLGIRGDRVRLAQVIANLLNNAAKYTDPGGRIELTAAREDGEAVLRVRDTGIGIPAHMLPRVFELFVQVTEGVDRVQGGLGIGLTLVQRLLEMHGGTVSATSEGAGRGSEFTVRLPLEAEAAGETDGNGTAEPGSLPGRRADAAPPPRCRVLLVDDNADAADTLAALLRLEGHEVATAYTGGAGLEAVDAFAPDVLLLDIGLPEMDGYEVARRLRDHPRRAATTVVALTGYGQESDRRKSAEAGFDRHLVKPVAPKELSAMLAGLAGARA